MRRRSGLQDLLPFVFQPVDDPGPPLGFFLGGLRLDAELVHDRGLDGLDPGPG